MKRHLFLTGPSGWGKSPIIREELGGALAMAGGFVTERTVSPEGRLLGFDLLPAAAAGGVEGFEPLRFLDYSTEPPAKNNEIFRLNAAQMLAEAVYYPFSLIDEFGGFELIIPEFRAALTEFLNAEQPCIGVLKGGANAEELRRRFGLGEKYTAYTLRLLEALNGDEDTLVLPLREKGDPAARRIVRQWAREYVK